METLAHRDSPVTACPPSYLGGSQTTVAQSSPTEVTRTASGGSGTSEVGGRRVRGTLTASGNHPQAQPLRLSLLTHNPQEDGGHIFAGGVSDLDGIAALICPLGTLNHEAAAVHSLLDADPALGG